MAPGLGRKALEGERNFLCPAKGPNGLECLRIRGGDPWEMPYSHLGEREIVSGVKKLL